MKLIDQIMLLPDDEKLLLVNQILESVADEKKEYALPKEVIMVVEERVARYKKNPSSGLNLDEFKSQLKSRISRKK